MTDTDTEILILKEYEKWKIFMDREIESSPEEFLHQRRMAVAENYLNSLDLWDAAREFESLLPSDWWLG